MLESRHMPWVVLTMGKTDAEDITVALECAITLMQAEADKVGEQFPGSPSIDKRMARIAHLRDLANRIAGGCRG